MRNVTRLRRVVPARALVGSFRSAGIFGYFGVVRSLGLAGLSVLSAVAVPLGGCARAPSPLAPHLGGSIGMPHRGVLTTSAELPRRAEGLRWLRDDDHHHGLPRFVATIERAAEAVARARPGATLTVGDLSARSGGRLLPHSSHRSGRDADLLLYVQTLDGAPIEATDWIHIAADGLGWDEKGQRYVRLDVERQWLLVKALVTDDDARVQWLFVSRPVRSLLLEWARARGEPADTIVRAMDTLWQPPPPAQSHDDHIHVRTACDPSEIAAGCEPSGPERPWLAARDAERAPATDTTTDLLLAILRPLEAAGSGAPSDGKASRRP